MTLTWFCVYLKFFIIYLNITIWREIGSSYFELRQVRNTFTCQLWQVNFFKHYNPWTLNVTIEWSKFLMDLFSLMNKNIWDSKLQPSAHWKVPFLQSEFLVYFTCQYQGYIHQKLTTHTLQPDCICVSLERLWGAQLSLESWFIFWGAPKRL